MKVKIKGSWETHVSVTMGLTDYIWWCPEIAIRFKSGKPARRMVFNTYTGNQDKYNGGY